MKKFFSIFMLVTTIAILPVLILSVRIYQMEIQYNYCVTLSTSASMEPTIRTGCIIIFKPITNYEANIGDIVLFKNLYYGEIPLTHRVIGICEDGDLMTQGDNRFTNGNPDPCATSCDNVIGIVVGTIDDPITMVMMKLLFHNKISYPNQTSLPTESGWIGN